MARNVDLARLQELASERDAARAEVDAHLRRCVASAPHGYVVCQMRYERLTARLAEAERRLAAVTDLARLSTE